MQLGIMFFYVNITCLNNLELICMTCYIWTAPFFNTKFLLEQLSDQWMMVFWFFVGTFFNLSMILLLASVSIDPLLLFAMSVMYLHKNQN